MRFRKKFKPKYYKGPLPFRYVLVISTIIFILLTIQGLYIIEKGIRPTLLHIANMETYKIATHAINYAVSNTIKDVDMNELVLIEKNEKDEITSISFDGNVYNQIVTQSVANAQHYMKLMEEGKLHEIGIVEKPINSNESDVIYEIPLGRVTDNTLLAQFGPLVPVKFMSIGEVTVQLNENIQPVGINNTWISISMDLKIQARVIIPFASDLGVVHTTVPVGMVYVPGKVPEFYSGKDGSGITPAIITND